MIRLEDIRPGQALTGLEPAVLGAVVSVVPIADGAVTVIYRTPEGQLKERLLSRTDEAAISLATQERPWSFAGDGELFKLVVEAIRVLTSATPVVLSGALIVPGVLLRKLRGEDPPVDGAQALFSTDPAARARIEQLAMAAVRRLEESRGCQVVDVSAQKCGWDITSYPPAVDGKQPDPRHIEVKGRAKGANTVTITRNEILYALNQSDKFRLAIVLVGEGDSIDGPHYLACPFTEEPGWGVSSVNYDLGALLEHARKI